jgi:hypothetical protein
MAIGLLALVCAILIAAVAARIAVQHRHNAKRPPTQMRSVAWIESDHLCG